MWRRFLRRRPWFQMSPKDGSKFGGQVLANQSLELTILTGLIPRTVTLTPKEVETLVAWLFRTYLKDKSDEKEHLAEVVPLIPTEK